MKKLNSILLFLLVLSVSCEHYPPIYVETHTSEGRGLMREDSASMIVLDSAEFSIGLYKMLTTNRQEVFTTRRDVLRADIGDPDHKEIWYHIVEEDSKDIDFQDHDEFLLFMDERGYTKINETDSLHHTFYTFKKK